jgi:Tfp pilus assembly protein FimT
VLTLLAVAAALITPAISNFIRGRSLDAEAMRLLSLTRAAQSRAVSEGMPVLLWLDAEKGAYGSEEESRSEATDPKALEFSLHESVSITVNNSATDATQLRHLPAIRFMPDDSIDEGSPDSVRLNDSTGASLWLVQTQNRMGYEIQRDHK